MAVAHATHGHIATL